ncbi:hypothetical protein BJV74DRAFT_991054 [Russula compacta]|nr:hypothetical protein BJV74DRAFT_991054 [Russula compacta]
MGGFNPFSRLSMRSSLPGKDFPHIERKTSCEDFAVKSEPINYAFETKSESAALAVPPILPVVFQRWRRDRGECHLAQCSAPAQPADNTSAEGNKARSGQLLVPVIVDARSWPAPRAIRVAPPHRPLAHESESKPRRKSTQVARMMSKMSNICPTISSTADHTTNFELGPPYAAFTCSPTPGSASSPLESSDLASIAQWELRVFCSGDSSGPASTNRLAATTSPWDSPLCVSCDAVSAAFMTTGMTWHGMRRRTFENARHAALHTCNDGLSAGMLGDVWLYELEGAMVERVHKSAYGYTLWRGSYPDPDLRPTDSPEINPNGSITGLVHLTSFGKLSLELSQSGVQPVGEP